MSDTPETDEEEFDTEDIYNGGLMAVTADFARELERSRNVLVAFIESLTDLEGPYPYLNGTGVVFDARKALAEMKGEHYGR